MDHIFMIALPKWAYGSDKECINLLDLSYVLTTIVYNSFGLRMCTVLRLHNTVVQNESSFFLKKG